MDTCFVTGGSGYVGRNLLRGLHAQGLAVRALVRSPQSAEIVQALGATPVRGDMADYAALAKGMAGADCLFHLAADTAHGPASNAQLSANVEGTKTVLAAARKAGVRRALHLSTEAVLLSGAPLRNATEAMPYPEKFAGGYSHSKAMAEQAALACNGEELEVVVVRPRFVWGRDDTTALPALIEAAQSGKLAWIGGGHYLTSTTHVDNAVHGMLLAMEKGQPGEAYFVSDGPPQPFRQFVTRLLETQGVKAPTREVPRWLVAAVVRLGERAARLTGGRITGPMSWQEYATLGGEVTLDISKAKRVLGYAPVTRVDEGMAALRA